MANEEFVQGLEPAVRRDQALLLEHVWKKELQPHIVLTRDRSKCQQPRAVCNRIPRSREKIVRESVVRYFGVNEASRFRVFFHDHERNTDRLEDRTRAHPTPDQEAQNNQQ
jgi:hypothetical protein